MLVVSILVLVLVLPVLVVTMLTPLPVSASDPYYDIQAYDVQMSVGLDNVYRFTETVTARFKSPRHGIFRDIPTNLYGYRHKIQNITVVNPDTGLPHPYTVSRTGDMLSLRIGDADAYVEGVVRYRIGYMFDASDDRNTDRDEVYFNLIGTSWTADIEKATLRIDMPAPFDATELQFYAGAQGSTDTGRVDWQLSGSSILAQTTGPLLSNEGVTLWLPLDEGYFTDVSSPSHLLLVLAVLLLHMAAFGAALYGMFRDANGHRIVPVLSFRPPDNLNPAEIAYVFKEESVGNRDMATLVIRWASMGCVQIVEDQGIRFFGKGNLPFFRLKELPAETMPYERSLFGKFFAIGSNGTVTTAELSETLHSHLTTACTSMKKRFQGDQEILVNRFQKRTVLGILGQGLLTVLSIAFSVNAVLAGGAFWGAFLLSFFGLFVTLLAVAGASQAFKGGAKGTHILKFTGMFVIWFLVVGVPALVGLGEILPLFLRPDLIPLVAILPLCLGTVVVLWKTKVYTPYALDLIGRIRGFRNFLETAKRDRLEMLFHEDPTWFYDMLPYAMVFGLTGIWERHMRTMSVPPPTWYDSPVGFRPDRFSHSMRSMVNTAVSTPSSSGSGGSSGGGSSGGGGGGGGGGSW